MIQGFFFDLDGTLVDTYEADYLAYRDAILEVTGINVAKNDFYKTQGEEMRQKLAVLAPGLSEDKIQAVAASKKANYEQHLHTTVPNEELISFLANFSEHHAMVLVTTSKRQNALKVLEKYDLKKHFSDMVFGEDVDKPKPDPEGYLKALRITGLQPHEVIAFEDTQVGVQAAEAAGIAVVHVRKFNV